MKIRQWFSSHRFLPVYLALVCWCTWRVGEFYAPRTGFTSLILFGDRFAPQRLPQLRDVPIYTLADSDGYDGQFYAELAVAGNPLDPGLTAALDSPAYRTRRLLLPLLAHVVGLGRPAWVLNAYALANWFCWLVLGWILARWWFPPTGWHNLLRWSGTLFGSGMIISVTRSLTDGPALLGIALGARCVETNRRWLGACAFAATGFIRETGILGVAAFMPDSWRNRRGWWAGALALVACAAPAFIWAALMVRHHGHAGGAEAFALPLTGFVRKLFEVARIWRRSGFVPGIRDEVWALIALPVQVAFLASRPKPDLLWWRIGAAFVVLWIFLAWPGWEGTPSAATRYVLPLTLAFNMLAPCTRLGLVLLLAGNLTVWSAPTLLRGVPSEQTTFTENVTCAYGPGWYRPEHLGWQTWRWARPSAEMELRNPGASAVAVTLDFEVASLLSRTVVIHAGATKLSIALTAGRRIPVQLGPFVVPSGATRVVFEADRPPANETGAGHRLLSFALYDLTATAVAR